MTRQRDGSLSDTHISPSPPTPLAGRKSVPALTLQTNSMRHAPAAALSTSTASTAEHSDSHSDSRAHRSTSPSPTQHNHATLAQPDEQYGHDAEPYSAQSSSSLSSSSSASSSSSGGSSSGHSDSDSEGSSGYKKGGYHPVLIGDVYANGRYTVERKLGWGHFSTVWLATDNSVPSSHPHRFVAIKVQKSATQYTEAAEDEIKLLTCAAYGLKRKEKRYPSHKPPVHSGRSHVITLLHHFVLTGPHGRHVCLVFECLGPNLLSLIKRYNYQGVPVPLVKHVTRQILLGLDWLHRVCGVIHTDLKVQRASSVITIARLL